VASVDAILQRVLAVYDVRGAVVLDRHGRVVLARLPESVNLLALAVMVSSMFEAATNIGEEFNKPPPQRIEIQTPNGGVVIAAAGPEHLLAVILSTWDARAFVPAVEQAADALHESLHPTVLVG
jgi:predicted regulator of Ras-like GTPase activity (Roadblock/LC7/MglB family)